MTDRVSEVLLRYKVDKQSTKETEKSARDIRGALDDIARSDAIKQAAQDFARYAVETKKAGRAADLFSAQLKKIGASDSEIKSAARAFRDYRNEIENADDAIRRLNQSQDRFDSTSKRVALAGDFQSNLGALRGLSGLAGLGGAGEGIGAAGEIVALAEELPRLKEAAAGLPGTLKAAASALGPTGLGLGAAAIVAVGAFALLSAEMKKTEQAAKEMAEVTARQREAETDIEFLLATDETEAAIRKYLSIQDEQTKAYINLSNAIDDLDIAEAAARTEQELEDSFGESAFNNVGRVARENAKLIQEQTEAAVVDVEAANERISASFKALSDAGITQEQIDAVREQSTATAEATDAIKEHEQALLRNAESARQRVLIDAQLAAMSANALKDRAAQMRTEIAANEAAAKVLRDAGQDATQYAAAIEELNRQLGLIETSLLPVALAAERAKENKEQAIKELGEEKALAAERAAIAENLRKELQAIALDTARRQLEAFEKLQESVAQLEGDLARDLANANERARRDTAQAQIDFQRQQVEADIAHYRTLEDLRRKFERAEQDASLDRDFRRLFELRQQRQREFEDAARARQDQLSDEQRAFDQQAADRAAALQQERQDLIAAAVIRRMELQADYQKQLQTIRENQARQLVELSEKYGFELQIRQDGHSQEAALLQNAINAELQLRQQGYIAELTLLQQFIGASVSLLTPRSTGSTSSTTPITKTLGTGNTTSTPSVPSTPAKGDGGSKPPVTINVNGGNEDRVIKVINKVLSQ